VFKAQRWLYHSTLGSRVIKKKTQHAEVACRVSTIKPTANPSRGGQWSGTFAT